MDFPPRLYFSEIEFEFAAGLEAEKFAGGMVFAFVESPDARVALTRIESETREQGLKIICVEFVSLYEGAEWEDEETQERYDSLAVQAKGASIVVFDELSTYER